LKAITENKETKFDQVDVSKIKKSSTQLSPEHLKNQK
jgi:hypothetical protein